MNILIVTIHVTAAVILVLTVLLQAGKGSGMGAAFGGSSGTVFGARGPATLISKITCGAAVIFMLTSLNLALSQGGVSVKGSIMDEWSATESSSAPAASPAPPAAMATPAPAAEPESQNNPVPAPETAPEPEPVSPPAASDSGPGESS